MPTIARFFLVACLALLSVAGPARAAGQPDWLTQERLHHLFPEATYTGPLTGKPPAMQVYGAGSPIGFVFSTAEMTDVVGFSGAPFNFVVGLDLHGKIVGVELVEHEEPIIKYNSLGAALTRFIGQYTGLDPNSTISLSGQGTPGGIDGISGACVNAGTCRSTGSGDG